MKLENEMIQAAEPKNLLVFNCGSSSQSFSVYQLSDSQNAGGRRKLASGKARNVATPTKGRGLFEWKANGLQGSENLEFPSHTDAANRIIQCLKENQIQVDLIGHRFVHGGRLFNRTVVLDDVSMSLLPQTFHLAPIHNPNSYHVIEVCKKMLPEAKQYAVFDNAFHAGMPAYASVYAIPQKAARENGFQKYGFHGLSYQYVSGRIAKIMKRELTELKLILCHLGTGGSSVCGLKNGHTLDTSMGYSPLSGLIMSTRSGDVDPEVVLEMIRQGSSTQDVDHLLNFESGLLGLSGYSSNLAEILTEAEAGNEACRLAWDAYVHRLRRTIGGLLFVLGGADAIVFTDDVGVRIGKLREAVCTDCDTFGIELDRQKNLQAPPNQETCVSSAQSRVEVWVIPTDEESVITDEIEALVKSNLTG